jgi:glucosamine--fructose-6-phosphate aminotransferase (isomerizing)
MCGIFGFVSVDQSAFARQQVKHTTDLLFRLSETRGREAAGIAVNTAASIKVHKDALSASKMLRSPGYARFLDEVLHDLERDWTSGALGHLSLIGHARLVTNGAQLVPENNQPVARDGAVTVHNGIIVNSDELWREAGATPLAQVDTEIIPHLVQKYRAEGQGIGPALRRTFAELAGEASIGLLLSDADVMLVGTNTGSVYYAVSEDGRSFFYSSEYYIAKSIADPSKGLVGFKPASVRQLKSGQGLIVHLNDLRLELVDISRQAPQPSIAAPAVELMLQSQRSIEIGYEREEQKRQGMRRCTRCVLPETMPFITFDHEGVCNYCHNYQPIETFGRDALEEKLAPHRGKSAIGDCLVAVSGGRDSCYGLHLLVEELDMRPVAYTYDWGMVTDLARRNQARMCGQLGVEHIWVSADIKGKRKNIRSNVNAWLKQPELGMVPLFMAGDKQFFWYANQTMEQTGIELMIFCMNSLERTHFKTGFANVAPSEKQAKSTWMMGGGKQLQLIKYYGWEVLKNPRYLNQSVFDSVFAYASYYFVPKNYIYLFHYMPWKEEVVDDVLINQYGWEKAKDTETTWRIGDGTAAFYNYVYYTIAGLTEHDTFRSNEIREGLRTREDALQKVWRDNQPRWESIREYMRTINVDVDDVIRVVNSAPKLYMADE